MTRCCRTCSIRSRPPGSLSARWHAKRQQWADRYPALANLIAPPQHGHDHDPYQRPFYRSFRRFLDTCLRHRWWVIAATIALFVFSLMMFRFVPQQFFPDSTRPELMVDIELAEGASLRSTQAQAEKLEKLLSRREGIANYVSYVGTGSPRFYLPLDQQLRRPTSPSSWCWPRTSRRASTRDWLLHEVIPKFPDVQMRVTRWRTDRRSAIRCRCASPASTSRRCRRSRAGRGQGAGKPARDERQPDWSEPSKVVRLVVDQSAPVRWALAAPRSASSCPVRWPGSR